MTIPYTNRRQIENSLIRYYKLMSIAIYNSNLHSIDTIVLAYITLYEYTKESIKAAAKRDKTTTQVVRNSVSKLLKLKLLSRHYRGDYGIIVFTV